MQSTQPLRLPVNRTQVLGSAVGCALLMLVAQAAAAAPADHAVSLKDQWRSYLHEQMMPEFSWVDRAPTVLPTVFSSYRNQLVRQWQAESDGLLAFEPAGPHFNFSLMPENHHRQSLQGSSLGVLGSARSALAGEFVSSSIEQRFGQSSRLSLGAVLARQRFASAGLGMIDWDAPLRAYGTHPESLQETATGGGIRIDFDTELQHGFAYSLGVQSKINMEPFKSYRGVYSEPGDFDIPGSAEMALSYRPDDHWQLTAGVERVFYSGIDAFTSAALPTRFLSLLGDGNSPVFEWRDLTVYSLETAIDDRHGGQWSLRYTTQQQPEPTSAILLRALSPDYTDTNFALGYRRGLGSFGNLSLAASYAASHYFLGASPYVQRELDSGSQIEVEAVWSISF